MDDHAIPLFIVLMPTSWVCFKCTFVARANALDNQWDDADNSRSFTQEEQHSSRKSHQKEATMVNTDKVSETPFLTTSQESSEKTKLVRSQGAQPIIIDGRDYICSVTFLANGKHFVSSDCERNIWTWYIQDGNEVGMPMNTGVAFTTLQYHRMESGLSVGRREALWPCRMWRAMKRWPSSNTQDVCM